jgi:hypothetical protein
MFRRSFFATLFAPFALGTSSKLYYKPPVLKRQGNYSVGIRPCEVCNKPSSWRSLRLGEVPSIDGQRCYAPLGIQYGHTDPRTGKLLGVCDKPNYELIKVDD